MYSKVQEAFSVSSNLLIISKNMDNELNKQSFQKEVVEDQTQDPEGIPEESQKVL